MKSLSCGETSKPQKQTRVKKRALRDKLRLEAFLAKKRGAIGLEQNNTVFESDRHDLHQDAPEITSRCS